MPWLATTVVLRVYSTTILIRVASTRDVVNTNRSMMVRKWPTNTTFSLPTLSVWPGSASTLLGV